MEGIRFLRFGSMHSYKRFFAFGCSFTNYHWPTWADILGTEFQFYKNFGYSGSGNNLIFHKIINSHLEYNFDENDLIIVMWSNFDREDRYIDDEWKIQINFHPQFVSHFYDEKHSIVYNSTLLAATYEFLEKTKAKFIFTSMGNYDYIEKKSKKISGFSYNNYKKYYDFLLPNQIDFTYPNNSYIPFGPNGEDNHPSPIEHLNYLEKILLPELDYPITISEEIKKNLHFIFGKMKKKILKDEKQHKEIALLKKIFNLDLKNKKRQELINKIFENNSLFL